MDFLTQLFCHEFILGALGMTLAVGIAIIVNKRFSTAQKVFDETVQQPAEQIEHAINAKKNQTKRHHNKDRRKGTYVKDGKLVVGESKISLLTGSDEFDRMSLTQMNRAKHCLMLGHLEESIDDICVALVLSGKPNETLITLRKSVRSDVIQKAEETLPKFATSLAKTLVGLGCVELDRRIKTCLRYCEMKNDKIKRKK